MEVTDISELILLFKSSLLDVQFKPNSILAPLLIIVHMWTHGHELDLMPLSWHWASVAWLSNQDTELLTPNGDWNGSYFSSTVCFLGVENLHLSQHRLLLEMYRYICFLNGSQHQIDVGSCLKHLQREIRLSCAPCPGCTVPGMWRRMSGEGLPAFVETMKNKPLNDRDAIFKA